MNETHYRLYVPAPGTRTHVDAGSAIVGERRGDVIDAHYERGGASNVQTFEDRILHAAGRRSHRYPTSARSGFPADEMIDVGSVQYDDVLRRWYICDITDAEALEAWAPGPHVIGGSARMREEAAGSLYSRFSSTGIMNVSMEMGAGTAMIDAIIEVAARPGSLR